MIIKVCGMREPENVRDVENLGVDMIGFVFCADSERYVSMVSSNAGIIPDYAYGRQNGDEAPACGAVQKSKPHRVGVFVDDMPQNIVTRIYNYNLDYVQLHGSETAVMIDNLRRTVDPDIRPGLKIIKALSIRSEQDVKRWREYEGHADMLLFDIKGCKAGGNGEHFDWTLLDVYHGNIPFLLSGGISVDDVDSIRAIRHPMFAGVDLNSRFEVRPGLKDVALLREFIRKLE
ncbi:phosphoribosylanthranilate isomerase [uncultured Prevotella sp.]|mgnify:FL=1|uniref:phosphoribosylanthranilate isomerase n=1 Tax=uncultured Prevotella sp. TaxID=159272 RepID=UPI00261CA512|nr:phosphoribosylanthranilate isomerase [uncultured Prevotella sp.]